MNRVYCRDPIVVMRAFPSCFLFFFFFFCSWPPQIPIKNATNDVRKDITQTVKLPLWHELYQFYSDSGPSRFLFFVENTVNNAINKVFAIHFLCWQFTCECVDL